MYVSRNPHFSEFSYGYAVTEDLVLSSGATITIAPVFPSLIEENQLGFDAMLDRAGKPLFLQFKLAHRMTGRAQEARKGLISAPFYRMHLRCSRESNQHANLLALEESGEEVFYVAPRFHLTEQLNEAYQLRQVWARSFQLAPSCIGDLDEGPHHVSFTEQGEWIVLSEHPRRRGSSIPPRDFLKRWEMSIAEAHVPIRQAIERVDFNVMRALKQRQRFAVAWANIDTGPIERLSPLHRVAYLARHFFDAQFFLATQKDTPAAG